MKEYDNNLPYGEVEIVEIFIIVECPYCQHQESIDNIKCNYLIHNCGQCNEDYEVRIKIENKGNI